MTLPINYADGQTIHGTDVDSWTSVINTLVGLAIPTGYSVAAGYATTVTSSTPVTLIYTSSGVQAFTGSTAQTVALPTTSVTTGMTWVIDNASSATVTVNASGGATVGTVAAGVVGIFAAVANTPTTAAGWTTTFQQTLVNPAIQGYTEKVQALGTCGASKTIGALTGGTLVTGTLTASTACTFTMPTATAGMSFAFLLKQAASTGAGTATFTGVKWPASTAPTQTTTAATMDIYSFISDGTDWYGSSIQNYTP